VITNVLEETVFLKIGRTRVYAGIFMRQMIKKNSNVQRIYQGKCYLLTSLITCLVFVQAGCRTPSEHRQEADKVALISLPRSRKKLSERQNLSVLSAQVIY